jgi:hypothetical protein
MKDSIKHGYLLVKTNIVSLTGVDSRQALEISLEKSIFHYFSVQVTGGYQLYGGYQVNSSSSSDTVFLKPSGYKASAELRWYFQDFFFPRFTRPDGVYGGLQFFYRHYEYNRSLDFHHAMDTVYYTDHFGVRNTCAGINLTGGFQKKFGRFAFDAFGGVGVMQRTISNTNLEYNPDNGDSARRTADFHLNQLGVKLPSNGGRQVNFSVGFRLGYFIYRKKKSAKGSI